MLGRWAIPTMDPHSAGRQMRAGTWSSQGSGQSWSPGPRLAGHFEVSPWGSSLKSHFLSVCLGESAE